MNTDDFSGPGIAERLTRALKSFGTRILVHAGSLCASIAVITVGEPAAAKASGSFLAVFSAYIGLICLFYSSLSRSLNGIFPFAAGLLQAGLFSMLGAPAHAALLAGGAQSFLQQSVIAKGRMGSGWAALPFIFISAIMLLSGHNISFESMPSKLTAGALSFAGIGTLAWAIRIFLRRSLTKPFYIQKLNAALASMESSLNSGQLPAPMAQQLKVLVGEARQYRYALPSFDEQVERNILALESTASKISALSARGEPNLWDKAAGQTHSAILHSSNAIRPWLAAQATHPPQNARASLSEQAQAQQQNADKLLGKKELLPAELQPYVETIHRSAQSILDTVRDKPHNEHAAVQFLNRYLTASHRVSDEIIRLTQNGKSAEPISRQLARSKDILTRLEAAFAAEHARLMQTDVINLNAELGVLDSLLKMDGY